MIALSIKLCVIFFFFFQAEDGIRDVAVTGVQTCALPISTRLNGHEFMRRFLQHVLPKGLHKVRYYGLWHPARRAHAERARHMLLLDRPTAPCPATRSPETSDHAADRSANHTPSDETRICPGCKQGRLVRA